MMVKEGEEDVEAKESFTSTMDTTASTVEVETETETMEVNFRLDPNGRTMPPEVHYKYQSDIGLHQQQPPPPQTQEAPVLDYTTRVILTHFESLKIGPVVVTSNDTGCNDEVNTHTHTHDFDESNVINDILFDCDIADSCLMPRTFWIDHSMLPRCNLEQMAYDVLQYYCPKIPSSSSASASSSPSSPTNTSTTAATTTTLPQHCGAEWWVQIRPSPETTSRYTAPSYTDNKGNDTEIKENQSTTADNDGISFHWDKDEDLRLLCDGTVYVHPHLSTVTYLTDGGDTLASPTLIVEQCRVDNLTGEWILNNNDDSHQQLPVLQPNCHPTATNSNESIQMEQTTTTTTPTTSPSAFISWPSKGKHLCFDGRFLHAAPSNLIPRSNTSTVQVASLTTDSNCNARQRQRQRQSRRYTFLVNIWMYHHPVNVHAFPESMIDKMSGSNHNDNNDIEHSDNICNSKNQRIRLVLDSIHQNNPDNIRHNNPDNITINQNQRNVSQITTVTVTSDTSIQVYESDVKAASDRADTTPPNEASNNKIFTETEVTIQEFVWPLGDYNSNETIHASIPIDVVQSKKDSGSNVRIYWNNRIDHEDDGNCRSHNMAPSKIGLYLHRISPAINDTSSNDNNDDKNTAAASTATTIVPDSKRPRVDTQFAEGSHPLDSKL
jgi:hypothetical protein